ncbi:MAG TPA: hypothetical protein VHK70_08380 [Burkholderiaceae bacterium]|jgi:hypothetical protein|nr:hypothetical protein [Burkholderiaceae bacterium]
MDGQTFHKASELDRGHQQPSIVFQCTVLNSIHQRIDEGDFVCSFRQVGSMQGDTPKISEIAVAGAIITRLESRMPNVLMRARNVAQSILSAASASEKLPHSSVSRSISGKRDSTPLLSGGERIPPHPATHSAHAPDTGNPGTLGCRHRPDGGVNWNLALSDRVVVDIDHAIQHTHCGAKNRLQLCGIHIYHRFHMDRQMRAPGLHTTISESLAWRVIPVYRMKPRTTPIGCCGEQI